MYLFTFNLHIQQTLLAVFPCGRQCSSSQVLGKKGDAEPVLRGWGLGTETRVQEGCSLGTQRKEAEEEPVQGRCREEENMVL